MIRYYVVCPYSTKKELVEWASHRFKNKYEKLSQSQIRKIHTQYSKKQLYAMWYRSHYEVQEAYKNV